MRNLFYKIGLVLASSVLFNCEGSFVHDIEIDSSDFHARGVVYCFLTNIDERDSVFQDNNYPGKETIKNSGNRVFISNSMPGKYARDTFYSAHVTLMDGKQELPLSYIDDGNIPGRVYDYYRVEGMVRPGERYHLTARFGSGSLNSAPSKWQPISATDSMPAPVPFVLEEAFLDLSENENTKAPIEGYIDVKIQDEVRRGNLYRIEISAIPGDVSGTGYHQNPVTGVVKNPGNRVDAEIFGSFPDDLFEEIDFTKDGRKRIYFDIKKQKERFLADVPVLLVVRLTNLSENYSRYLHSVRQYYANTDNPFIEPVEVYTNVKNGYGVFATAARSYREIRVR